MSGVRSLRGAERGLVRVGPCERAALRSAARGRASGRVSRRTAQTRAIGARVRGRRPRCSARFATSQPVLASIPAGEHGRRRVRPRRPERRGGGLGPEPAGWPGERPGRRRPAAAPVPSSVASTPGHRRGRRRSRWSGPRRSTPATAAAGWSATSDTVHGGRGAASQAARLAVLGSLADLVARPMQRVYPHATLLVEEARHERHHDDAVGVADPARARRRARCAGGRTAPGPRSARRTPARWRCPMWRASWSAATWDRSAITPSRLHSRTTSWPNVGQPADAGLVGRAVGPRRVPEVGQRQVPRAERVHHPQRAERAVDASARPPCRSARRSARPRGPAPPRRR